tara:strand:- start:499 stop:735 length:237 start_codon:yes stop_codon:yes gene_type:complete
MAKGKASVSSSGASMSKYDVEVEARLKALESQAHPDRACTDGDDTSLEKRVAIIEASLRKLDKLGYKDIEEITAAELA